MSSYPLLSIKNLCPGGSPRYFIISGFNSVKCLTQCGLKKLSSVENFSPDQINQPVPIPSMLCLSPLIGIKLVSTLSASPILNSMSAGINSTSTFLQIDF